MGDAQRSLENALTQVLKRRLGQGGPWPRELHRHVERESRARGVGAREWLEGIERRPDDLASLIAAATVGHTSFFRHPDHFERLRELVPTIVASTPCVRVWSAGCSTGEEVWSLCLCLAATGAHFQIWASDVNARAVEVAARGVYPSRATVGLEGYDGKVPFRAPDALRKHVRFAVAALSEPLPAEAPSRFDVIFCRNVMIYFQADVVQSTWRMLASRLAPWGAIAVAPVESLSHVPAELERRGPLGWMQPRARSAQAVAALSAEASTPKPRPSLDASPDTADAVDLKLERVAKLLSLAEFDAAEQMLHALLALRDDALGWFLLGESCARRGETTQAKVAYLRAVRATHAPEDVDLETLQAAAQRRAQQLSRAGE